MLTQEKSPLQTSQIDWQPIIKEFILIVGKDLVVQRREELIAYECDGLTSYRQRPAVVVLPKTTEQVAALVRVCDRHSIPFIARGAGTGLSGGALPTENCVLIVTALMKKILKVDLENQRVVVQPGVINNWVTQAVSGAGFYYAPDPSSQIVCSIGGNIAENSGGVHCLKYGVTTNHVLGLKLVLPDGAIGILCIRRSSASGWLSGFASGLGAATADGIYGCIASFGLTIISDFLVSQQFILRLIGGSINIRVYFSRREQNI